MLITLIFLALSSSIDSLGIGISCGISGTYINNKGKLILFIVSFFISLLSILLGDFLKLILPEFITEIIGFVILIFIGIYVCISSFRQEISYIEAKNFVDLKTIVYLAVALSLDCFCIGIGTSIIGLNSILFPFFIAFFQFAFLNLGIFLGRKLNGISNLPKNVWSFISGLLLILIGIIRIIV